MKPLLFLLLSLLIGSPLAAQGQPDSTHYELIENSDSTYALRVTVYYSEDGGGGSVLSGTTPGMDSARFVRYLATLETDGGRIGQVRVTGHGQRAMVVRDFFETGRAAADLSQVDAIYERVAGQPIATTRRGFDDSFVGAWELVGRDLTARVTPVDIRYTRTGRLVIRGPLAQRSASAISLDEITIGAVAGLTRPVSLFRVDVGRQRFRSVDGRYTLRPRRDAGKKKKKRN